MTTITSKAIPTKFIELLPLSQSLTTKKTHSYMDQIAACNYIGALWNDCIASGLTPRLSSPSLLSVSLSLPPSSSLPLELSLSLPL